MSALRSTGVPCRRAAAAVRTALELGLAAVLSCGGEPQGPSGSLQLLLSVAPVAPVPGDTLEVTAVALATGGASVTAIRWRLSGLVDATDSMAFSRVATPTLRRSYLLPHVPPSGQVQIHAEAVWSGPLAVVDSTVAVADAAAPAITDVTVSPPPLHFGDALTVRYTATDDAGLAWVWVRWSGPFAGVDSIHHGFARQVSRTVNVPIPRSALPGIQVVVGIQAEDAAGHRAQAASGGPFFTDSVAPSLDLAYQRPTVAAPHVMYFVARGDTLEFRVSGRDDLRLGWLGYAIPTLGVRDSVAVAGDTASASFVLVVPPQWLGELPLYGFARDVAGNLAQGDGGVPLVVDAVRKPTHSVTVPGETWDAVYDARRGVLYMTQGGPPWTGGLPRLEVLDVATASLRAPIPLPAPAWGVDLTAGGDSLVVVMRSVDSLAIVDLVGAAPVTSTLGLSFTRGSDNCAPWDVASAANGLVLVWIECAATAGVGRILTYDLRARSQRVRSDAALDTISPYAVPFAVAGDRSRILVPLADGSGVREGTTYETASDNFLPRRAMVMPLGFPGTSADATGSRFMLDRAVFDGALNPVTVLQMPAVPAMPAFTPLLAADGQTALLCQDFGINSIRIADGAVLQRVFLPYGCARFLRWIGPDLVVAARGTQVHIVDLR